MLKRNIFATILTNAAPSSNYRGEGDGSSRSVLQKIMKYDINGKINEYTVISSESIKSAIREILELKTHEVNRTRLPLNFVHQIAVKYDGFSNENKYIDDFIFGYMNVQKNNPDEDSDEDSDEDIDNKKESKTKKCNKTSNCQKNRDSLLRMNIGVSISPYNDEILFHQSPMKINKEDIEKNQKSSNNMVLWTNEISYTAYQYPFAISLSEFINSTENNELIIKKKNWIKELLIAIGELSNVAGGHSRSYFEMYPKSIVLRFTDSLVCGYDTYGFDINGNFIPLQRVNGNDLPYNEFWIGGEIARNMSENTKNDLKQKGMNIEDNTQKLLLNIANEIIK